MGKICDPSKTTEHDRPITENIENRDVVEDLEAYKEELLRVSKETDEALRSSDSIPESSASNNAEKDSIFDMSDWDLMEDSFNSSFSSSTTFASVLDTSVQNKKRQLKRSTSKASLVAGSKLSALGKKAEEKQSETVYKNNTL